MRSPEAYAILQRLHRPVFASDEAVAAFRLSKAATSNALTRLAEDHLIVKLRQGLWAIPDSYGGRVEPFEVLPMLTRPFPSYVSLWTALAIHDMIEQIPQAIHGVSMGRPQVIPTSIGTFNVRQITPELYDLDGIGGATEVRAGIASPEKALFDTVYLLVARTGHGSLPEIELPAEFDVKILFSWVDRIESLRWKTLVKRSLSNLGLSSASQ